MSLKSDLEKHIVGEVLSDRATRRRYSADASIFRIRPRVVVFPQHTDDIQALVRYVAKQGKTGKNLSLTPRGGGSDMTGASIGSSILLDLQQHMRGILHIGSQSFDAKAGTPFTDIEAALAKRKLFYPPYPASKAFATIGGIVANNSGGEKTLKFGKTEQYVRSITAVLADGQEYELGSISLAEAKRCARQSSLLGSIYKQLLPLFTKHWHTIDRARPKVSKNSSGYALWKAYNPTKQRIDLSQLFVGSQGTLGIVTEASLRAIPIKPHSQMLVLYLSQVEQLTEVVHQLRQHDPSSIELFDDKTLGLALRFAPKLARLVSKEQSLTQLAVDLLPDAKILALHGFPKLVVMAEFTGSQASDVATRTTRAHKTLNELSIPIIRAHSDAEAQKYWVIRRQSFNLLRKEVKGKQTVPFIDDVVVPADRFAEFFTQLQTILDDYPQLQFSTAGHAGDGNLHVFPLMDMTNASLRSLIPEIAERVYELTLSLGGSLSGEHGDGLIRGPYLQDQFGPEVLKLFRAVKHAFDPDNIFNPHVKTGATRQYARSHIKTDNQHLV